VVEGRAAQMLVDAAKGAELGKNPGRLFTPMTERHALAESLSLDA
jgi:hypothetical protein